MTIESYEFSGVSINVAFITLRSGHVHGTSSTFILPPGLTYSILPGP